MAEAQQIRAAAASVPSARQAVQTATDRWAAALAAARNLAEAAHAAERCQARRQRGDKWCSSRN